MRLFGGHLVIVSDFLEECCNSGKTSRLVGVHAAGCVNAMCDFDTSLPTRAQVGQRGVLQALPDCFAVQKDNPGKRATAAATYRAGAKARVQECRGAVRALAPKL